MTTHILKKAVETAAEASHKVPKLFGIPTGIKGLDEMFYVAKVEDGKVKKVPLGGIPSRAIVNLTGIPETGKSLIGEQFVVTQASRGYNTFFVTVETPGPFVVQALQQRATAMNIDWEAIKDRIVLIDAASNEILREDLKTFLNTLEYAIVNYNTKNGVIDSITGLYEAKEVLARGIVRKVYNFLKSYGQTTILISQKRGSHEEETAEAAGGYAVSHITDCTIVLSKRLIKTRWEQETYHIPIGNILRTIRIDGCRMCGHDTATHIMEITELGLVEVGPPLEEWIKKGGGKKWS